MRVAEVRGAHDRYAGADPALVAAGARRFVIPFAGHSMRRLLVAGPIVESAVAQRFCVSDVTASSETAIAASASARSNWSSR